MMKLVIFDHSGVLVNDLRESWQAISKIIDIRGYKPDELNAFRRNFRLPYWEYLMYKGFNEREAKDSGVVKDYIRFYTETLEHVELFDDVKTSLSQLTINGLELALVSHSPREVVDMVMQKFNLAQFFKRNCVFTLEDYKRQKPHAESVVLALNKLGYSAANSIYVGDMREDIVAAKRAGASSAAIYREGGSYHIEQYLKGENPTFFIRSLGELVEMFG
jgi:phosphoglycolate phosphatase